MKDTGITMIFRYFPSRIQNALQRLSEGEFDRLQEIRLRAGRPVSLVIGKSEKFLTDSGRLTIDAKEAISIAPKELEQTFQAVCEYSIYRYAREITGGFVTLTGGNRVGIAGTAVYRDGVLTQIRDVSGMNFRIARAVTGCAEPLYEQVFRMTATSLLLSGTVGTGKTTMLRDLCRLLGKERRVVLIDERSEIAAVHRGMPRYDVGLHTDVLDGYARAEGLMTALRVLTPEILVCDEIGTQQDAEAILRVYGCGVPLIASAHASSIQELEQRPAIRTLLEQGVFRYIAVLDEKHQGKMKCLRQVVSK